MAFVRERPRKDGTTTFVVQWVEPDTGKQTTRTKATRRDADKLAEFLTANGNSFALAAQAASRLRSRSPTVDSVIAAHIDQLTAIGPDTRARYRRTAARHIRPILGAVPVDTLTRPDVAAWLNGVAGAAKTKKNVQALLSGALSTAVTEGVVAGNIAKDVQPPRGEAMCEAVFLTRSELALIVDALPPRSALRAEFLACTGLRFGEATALLGADLTLPDTPSAGADGAAGRGVVAVSKAWKTDLDADGRTVRRRCTPDPARPPHCDSAGPASPAAGRARRPAAGAAEDPRPAAHARLMADRCWGAADRNPATTRARVHQDHQRPLRPPSRGCRCGGGRRAGLGEGRDVHATG